ncbi:hypothetical protein BVH03_25035 [Pseudomonas sp. PA15(2017)]|uniref:DUF1654 domain-containing protein n=1 Tax=Pseudomonas sp. PA15(2017) TaxID=1932111 RepID=UPI00095B02E2|nr:DUF1654 domain-containing protein [Pseudomonas sp. PA15(2017)]OLU22491.1 hypothetical protein BVH03_25035 [Pseudomonas sp. PA15(2017)]
MAKGKQQTAAAPTTYELLGARVQRVINSPAAQKSRSAVLLYAEGDNPDDWAQLLDEIGENDNVTICHRDDGIQLFWTVPKDD